MAGGFASPASQSATFVRWRRFVRASEWNRQSVQVNNITQRVHRPMILSGLEIREQMGRNIVIDPFDERNLNPNSYNLTLHHELMTYEEVVLDMRKANRVRRIEIPKDGLTLSP